MTTLCVLVVLLRRVSSFSLLCQHRRDPQARGGYNKMNSLKVWLSSLIWALFHYRSWGRPKPKEIESENQEQFALNYSLVTSRFSRLVNLIEETDKEFALLLPFLRASSNPKVMMFIHAYYQKQTLIQTLLRQMFSEEDIQP